MCQFLRDEEGATALEYALLAMMVGMAIVGGAGAIGSALQPVFTTAATAVTP